MYISLSLHSLVSRFFLSMILVYISKCAQVICRGSSMLERKADSSCLSFISDISALTAICWIVITSPTLPVHSHQDDLSRSPSGMKARSVSGDEEEGPSDQIQISKELFLLVIQARWRDNDGRTAPELKWSGRTHGDWFLPGFCQSCCSVKKDPYWNFRQTLRGPTSTKAYGWFRSSQRSCQFVRSLGCWQ